MEFVKNFFLFITLKLISGSFGKTLNDLSEGKIGKNIETIVQNESMGFNYPEARRDDVVDDYHGTKIPDPYRWLENPDSVESKNFIAAENLITDSYLNSSFLKENVRHRLKEIHYYSRYSNPMRYGNKYYFLKKDDANQKQGFLYVQDTLDSEPKVFLDPNNFSPNGIIDIASITFSDDGTVLAYTLSENGSNGKKINFLNAETGEKYPDVLEQVIFGNLAWTHDNLGIFYTTYPQYNLTEKISYNLLKDMKVYYHRIGTPQSEDILVIEFPEEPLWKIKIKVSDNGQWLIVTLYDGTGKYSIYFTEIREKIEGKFNLTQIVDKINAYYKYIGNDDTRAIFLTFKNASQGKIIAIDLLNYEEKINSTTLLLSEETDKIIIDVTIVDNDKFVVQYFHHLDVNYMLQLHDLKSGKLIKKLHLGSGIINGVYGHRKYPECMFAFTSFLIPSIIYKLNVNKFDSLAIYQEAVLPNFNESLYEVIHVSYPSEDKTKIPMTIIMRKGAKLDGSMPVLLSACGEYGSSALDFFDEKNIIFIQNFNGIVAEAHIRGDIEYGVKWYEDGTLMKKQNGIDDFQAAAEYLIENGYTTSERLTIRGYGNGGLIVGACLNKRPDLFGAAVIVNGLFDMLRFHKFTTNYNLISDYGSSEDVENFSNLIKYSPLHNVKSMTNGGQYPATLVLADDPKNYIAPQHSLKFIATLQDKIGQLKQQRKPLMARIDFTSNYIENLTVLLTFIVKSLNLEYHF